MRRNASSGVRPIRSSGDDAVGRILDRDDAEIGAVPLDVLLARAAEVKQPKRRQSLIDFAEQARISRELVRLRDDVKPPLGLDDFDVRAVDTDKLLDFFRAQGFRSLIARVEAKRAEARSGD